MLSLIHIQRQAGNLRAAAPPSGSRPRAAIDREDRAGHVGGAVAEEPGGGLGDFVGVGHAAQWGPRRDPFENTG